MVDNGELYQKWMNLSREIRMSGVHQREGGPRGPHFKGCMPHGPMGPRFGGGMPHGPMGPRFGGGMPQGPMGPRFGGGMPTMPPVPPMPPRPHHFGRPGMGSWATRERLLVLIGNHPEGVRQKDLAWEAGINPSSASEIIGRLEADGFVTRTADEKDRRAMRLALTEAGKERAEQIKAEREVRLEDIFSKLTDEEKETLNYLLDKLMS